MYRNYMQNIEQCASKIDSALKNQIEKGCTMILNASETFKNQLTRIRLAKEHLDDIVDE